MKSFFNYKNISKSLKNLLIFFPLCLSNKAFEINNFYTLLFGFIIFFFITNAIYIINDFNDKKIDKKNILKETLSIGSELSKKTFLFVNFILIVVIFTSYFLGYFNKFLILYIINFYLYSYVFKKIKFFDILSLHFFYMARLAYGAELVSVNLSVWFIAFFSSLFLILAIGKRVIQIKENKLIYKNDIIPYTIKNIKTLKSIMVILALFNFAIIYLFFFTNHLIFFNIFSSMSTKSSYSYLETLLILFFYYLNSFRILYKLLKSKIKKDIFQYVVRDYFVIFSTFLFLITMKLIN